ncbi:hypothetical protein M0R88_16580 [Halorussus gelatinilyticus]|uniref:DUF7979 domain-containing protein n=1 Tax=Halorussus gelatinilyticus TaxID=2937524 RepID=A0A8U0IGA9_9EURY|nr:hypothetical protein [Halorussus gelatinilyticus]UPW00117.1 hypothetical protein M0R88_16580 [Halorussus gelatinilyticus]
MNARSAGVLLVVLGLALLAHPLYLFPHHGETAYSVTNVQQVGEQSPGETVAYDDLPPVARDRFEQALDREISDDVWTGEHAAAYEALSNHEYVRYRGEYYEYRLRGSGSLGMGGILRMALSTLAVILLVVGVFAARTDRYRPLTPRRTLWIPVGVFVALVATEYYDVLVGDAFEPQSYVLLPAMAAAFVSMSVVGSAVRDRGSLRPLVPVAPLVVAGTMYSVATGYGSADGGGAVAFALVTTPWFLLGYGLTAAQESAAWEPAPQDVANLEE